MKVIKPGKKIEPPAYRVTCPRCEAVLEYDDNDLWEQSTGARLVSCGQCGSPIGHNPSNWVEPTYQRK